MNILTSLLLDAAADSFVRLFTEMNAWTIVLFVLGIIFCAIEACVPGFGFFGIAGCIMIVAGIIVRMVCGGDLYMLLYMVLIALVLFCLLFFVASLLIRKGRLGKTAIFNVGTAVPEEKTEGTRDYAYLVGKTGVVTSVLRPAGKVEIDSEIYDVVARDGYIQTGAQIVVLNVEGQRIVVVENVQ